MCRRRGELCPLYAYTAVSPLPHIMQTLPLHICYCCYFACYSSSGPSCFRFWSISFSPEYVAEQQQDGQLEVVGFAEAPAPVCEGFPPVSAPGAGSAPS